MTPDAKRKLSATIRSLRTRLLGDLHDATETAYRLSVRTRDAGLDEAARVRRGRLEAWTAEQARASGGTRKARTVEDFRRDAEKQAAYTLLNRLVLLRLMEAAGLRAPAVVTGGWESRAYQDFRQLAPALVRGDETEGYAFLLRLVFEDLATELPGLYGPAPIADLVPVPAATLRHVVEAFDDPALESCWTDDMTLGWIYQYWNDPEREAIDAKLNAGGKVEPHEIASKTQMFTERYMVDWLLQNSLGPMWLAMCKKHGWTPEVETNGTLAALEERRVAWRAKRDAGEVALTDLMPLHSDAERRWAYYVPQPIPDDAVEHAPDSVRDLKILDPAVGSGHFLVVAFDLLVPLYQEEARHRAGGSGQSPVISHQLSVTSDQLPGDGDQLSVISHQLPTADAAERTTDHRSLPTSPFTQKKTVERILEHNLHGIDLDPRAVQIAAAALWLKARQTCADAQPRQLNLVASNLRLSSLPEDDPALVELRREVERETGIPAALTDTVVHALRGADHLGSLLKIDRAVEDAIAAHEQAVAVRSKLSQTDFLLGAPPQQPEIDFEATAARRSLLESLEGFLEKHTGGDDLGLRLHGEQLAAGVRFVRMVQEGGYDIVVANPPYLNTKKIRDRLPLKSAYPAGRADLYCAFVLRSHDLIHMGGRAALVTQRDWMCLENYADLRALHIQGKRALLLLADLDFGAFPGARDVSVAMSVFAQLPTRRARFIRPVPRAAIARDRDQWRRNVAGLLAQSRSFEVPLARFGRVIGGPFVYDWSDKQLSDYAAAPKIADVAVVGQGMATSDNPRFLRRPHEPAIETVVRMQPRAKGLRDLLGAWVPYVKGARGAIWFEPLDCVILWQTNGLEQKLFHEKAYSSYTKRIPNEVLFATPAISFNTVGRSFTARKVRYASILDVRGSAVFPDADIEGRVLCAMNSLAGRADAQGFNPGVNFQVGDVRRIHLGNTHGSEDEVLAILERQFLARESHREPTVEFRCPGPSPWSNAEEWAQGAIDRPDDAPLPPYLEELDPEPPTDHVSYALGVALGRFGANGEGILDPGTADLSHALPGGILFLDGSLDANDHRDNLGHDAARMLHDAWAEHAPAIADGTDLRTWMRLKFFADVHKGMYENRPIHWPLSSEKRTFVAWVTIHRWTEQTLRVLLADHLVPTLTRLDGELNDLRATRDGADRKAARAAEKRYAVALKARDELAAFIAAVAQCADKGAPPTHADPAKCPPREVDARYAPDLDDGVMINSAALWPLLEPQWKDPKKWWAELAQAKGRKDYDWAHLAMRYWPTRVDAKCKEDPSLGVAHGCFWKYHPARAWAWELRLQDEIGPDFRIEEAPYRGDGGDAEHRTVYLRDHAEEALQAVEKEALRRRGRGEKAHAVPEMRILEPGLWSVIPEKCWALELSISEKQGEEFRLSAPDEPAARAAFEAAHPEQVEARKTLLNSLTRGDLFDGAR